MKTTPVGLCLSRQMLPILPQLGVPLIRYNDDHLLMKGRCVIANKAQRGSFGSVVGLRQAQTAPGMVALLDSCGRFLPVSYVFVTLSEIFSISRILVNRSQKRDLALRGLLFWLWPAQLPWAPCSSLFPSKKLPRTHLHLPTNSPNPSPSATQIASTATNSNWRSFSLSSRSWPMRRLQRTLTRNPPRII